MSNFIQAFYSKGSGQTWIYDPKDKSGKTLVKVTDSSNTPGLPVEWIKVEVVNDTTGAYNNFFPNAFGFTSTTTKLQKNDFDRGIFTLEPKLSTGGRKTRRRKRRSRKSRKSRK
jgi:hypothetical protein